MRVGQKGSSFWGCQVLFILALFLLQSRPPFSHPAPPADLPDWWEVRVRLQAEGDYRLDAGGPSAVGHLAFAVQWTGWLEKDDQDYLLYRLDCRLCDWEARETFFLPEATKVLTTNDFPDKPGFNLKYFIRVGDTLRLDFLIDGLAVPLADGEGVFTLLLPSSQQNDQKCADIHYNDGIIKGSNRVEVPEAEIYSGPVDRAYSWTWKNQQWLLRQQQAVFTSQSHRVQMSLTITPHKGPPR